MPVFALFFPLEMAIALTGVVHLLNNFFKMYLVGTEANWRVVIKFGVPAIISAFFGAWLLMSFYEGAEWFTYSIGTKEFVVTPIKMAVAFLMFAFAFLELLPFFKKSEAWSGEDKTGLRGNDGPLSVQPSRLERDIVDIWVDAAVNAGYRRNPDYNGTDKEGVGHFQLTMKGGRRCSSAAASSA